MIDYEKIISPENKMSEERVKKMEAQAHKDAEDDFNRMMFIGVGSSNLMGRAINLMCQIVHNPKDNTIKMRGRIRYEETGNKSWFETKVKPHTQENYDELKKLIQEKVSGFLNFGDVFQPYQEIELPLSLSDEEFLKKLNDSNMFDIGHIPKE